MSLADELLADLEEAVGEDEDDFPQQNMEISVETSTGEPGHATQYSEISSITDIAKLSTSDELKSLLSHIAQFQGVRKSNIIGPVEQDPEYKLIVSASTTQGNILPESTVESIDQACRMAIGLHETKSKILIYVESRMSLIAPNLSAIVGASIAAKLMGISGGLTGLSKIPSCNVQVLGAQKASLSGFSSMAVNPHNGLVYQCEIVQSAVPDLKRKAAKLVAAKSSLAARVDSNHSCPTGTLGAKFKTEILLKLEKLNEPPPVKLTKALPAPLDGPRKRRGGKRVRKMKARFGETDLRKQANRMNFGEVEEDINQEDMGFSLGNIGKSSQYGSVRLAQVDKKTEVKLSKSLQRKLAKDQAHGGRTTIRQQLSGTASSVAFTPLEGLEIKNPDAAHSSAPGTATDKYFAATSGFLSVKRVL